MYSDDIENFRRVEERAPRNPLRSASAGGSSCSWFNYLKGPWTKKASHSCCIFELFLFTTDGIKLYCL